MAYVKMVKTLVEAGMKEDKAIEVVADAYSVEPKSLKLAVEGQHTHDHE